MFETQIENLFVFTSTDDEFRTKCEGESRQLRALLEQLFARISAAKQCDHGLGLAL